MIFFEEGLNSSFCMCISLLIFILTSSCTATFLMPCFVSSRHAWMTHLGWDGIAQLFLEGRHRMEQVSGTGFVNFGKAAAFCGCMGWRSDPEFWGWEMVLGGYHDGTAEVGGAFFSQGRGFALHFMKSKDISVIPVFLAGSLLFLGLVVSPLDILISIYVLRCGWIVVTDPLLSNAR